MLRITTPPIIFLSTLLIFILAFNTYTLFQLQQPQPIVQYSNPSHMGQRLSMMSFSEFDKEKARDYMDKNNDGKCDACGMPIDQCISGGMMQCSMDPAATIGVLGSQHVHADWKIYINEKALDLTSYSHMQRMREGKSVSSFIHVDSGAPLPEKTGDIIHMHATGIPLSMFFESIEMLFDNKKFKVFVNGKENKDSEKYVFKDLDKILITDGKGNIQEQLKSITNFAGAH